MDIEQDHAQRVHARMGAMIVDAENRAAKAEAERDFYHKEALKAKQEIQVLRDEIAAHPIEGATMD